MKQMEKSLKKAGAGAAAGSLFCLIFPEFLCRKLHIRRETEDFAGQKPGFVWFRKGEDGPTAVYCSTEYEPRRFERIAAAASAACSVLLFAASALLKLHRKKKEESR